ncbi:MAG: GDSL-type esterase/lipase family protein, partial [Planctomycetota bacterium]
MPGEPTPIACVGASITFGRGLANRRSECYPAVLQTLLGDGCRVRNFGYSGATAGRVTNEPYWETPSFTSATRFVPQVCVLGFGSNDAQHVNLANLPRFRDDYTALVEHFRSLGDRVAVVLTQPLPVFEPLPEIDAATLDTVIRPTIDDIGRSLAIPVVD